MAPPATGMMLTSPEAPSVIARLSEMPWLTGLQRYHQRLAALRAGRTFTRLPSDSFRSVWEGLQGANPALEQWRHLFIQEARAMARGQGENRLTILIGDSLTFAFPSEILPGGRFWLNQGISGENTSQILHRLSAAAAVKPHAIYVLAGINDLRQGSSDRQVVNNLRRIIRDLQQQQPAAQIIIQSILPTRFDALPGERIDGLNQALKGMVRTQAASYFDLNAYFRNSRGKLQLALTTDGLHLSLAGYQVWQQALHIAETRIMNGRDEAYQQWLRRTDYFVLEGRKYHWGRHQVQLGETLEMLANASFGRSDVYYSDLIAIRNDFHLSTLTPNQIIDLPNPVT